MRYVLLIIVSFTIFLKADLIPSSAFVIHSFQGDIVYCVSSYKFLDGTNKVNIVLSSDLNKTYVVTAVPSDFLSGWEYNTTSKKCYKFQEYNLNYRDYNFVMSLVGFMIGFSVFFFILYLGIIIVKK